MSPDPMAPRWHGQAGFFEIWFVVVFDGAGRRAWWLRYTTFAPRVGEARGTVWAAAFEAGGAARWAKRFVPLAEVRAAVADLARGVCAGHVETADGPLAWDLRLRGGDAVTRGPAWLHRVPTPTRVAHVRGEAAIEGTVRIGGTTPVAVAGLGALKHLWGTRRVEELFWVYCPRLGGGGAFEATTVRPRRASGLAVSPVWIAAGGREHRLWSVPGLRRNRIEPDGPGRLRVRATSATAAVEAVAACDPRTLAGWVYRDPSGFDLHVAQSDVARCEVVLRTRPHRFAAWSAPRRLAGETAAIEFHHPEPIPGVRYVAWDGRTASEDAQAC